MLRQRFSVVIAAIALTLLSLALLLNFRQAAAETPPEDYKVYLPLVLKDFPPIPKAPALDTIDNSDQNNQYIVSWLSSTYSDTYVLQESTNPNFTNPVDYPMGTSTSWATPQGKFPATYYYRVKGVNQYGSGEWSVVRSVTIYPLFVGLQARWDGMGYLRGSQYENIGSHYWYDFWGLIETDTIAADFFGWYDPNPFGFSSYWFTEYYSPTTGLQKNFSPDPAWKWQYPMFLPYSAIPVNGSQVNLNGQIFTVSGPLTGTTTWGTTIQYWELKNKNKFLFFNNGDPWTQYVEVGDAVLRYDAGSSRLGLRISIKRTFYYNGGKTSDTIQYIHDLTSATSIPGSPAFEPYTVAGTNQTTTEDPQNEQYKNLR